MRALMLTMCVLGCSPPPAATPFQFTERLETRPFTADRPLRAGGGFDPLTLAPRDRCFKLTTLTPTYISGSSAAVDLAPGPDTTTQVRRHFASLGEDGDVVGRSTASEVEAAFSAGAAGVTMRTAWNWVERTVQLGQCERTVPTAREFIEQCGAGYVWTEGYRKVGVGLEVLPAAEPAPVHFVLWGAPAPSAPTDEALKKAIDVTGANASDLTQDLPATEGTRRLARLAGYPGHQVAWCITAPVVGATCLEGLINQLGLMRLPSPTISTREYAWRAVEEGPTSSQPTASRTQEANALRARRVRCLEVELPAAVSRCTAAFSAQASDVCAQCAAPPTCDPQRLADDWDRLGAP